MVRKMVSARSLVLVVWVVVWAWAALTSWDKSQVFAAKIPLTDSDCEAAPGCGGAASGCPNVPACGPTPMPNQTCGNNVRGTKVKACDSGSWGDCLADLSQKACTESVTCVCILGATGGLCQMPTIVAWAPVTTVSWWC